ncbi:MAG: PilT/PilU family type 4a pilus ATPase [Planctomycetaceae bacterium]|nr:PilT/PilU family type 4a pilus ATPase [Planctomycetaceae bacterium]
MSHPGLLQQWLSTAACQGASDLHLVPGFRPTLRLHGNLKELPTDELTQKVAHDLLMDLCPESARLQLQEQFNADFALQLDINGCPQRYRANYFISGQQLSACFRVISGEIPDFQWAGFPEELAQRLAHLRNGLVLISGVTGAGKTTSLAMIVNLLNQETGHRIITIEEPIEYLFPRQANSIVTQREVGQDVRSFADGLKFGLRQDPDVMLVGEIRDRETAQMALSAAETGHLVFSTLHTRDAKGAISRYVDLFPQSVQHEIRSQLSLSLRAVVSQHLLPSILPGEKRELALEVMFNNIPISSAIRFGKIESIETNIQTGRSDGMISMDEAVKRLLDEGRISRETAERFVTDRNYLGR